MYFSTLYVFLCPHILIHCHFKVPYLCTVAIGLILTLLIQYMSTKGIMQLWNDVTKLFVHIHSLKYYFILL